MPDTAHLYAASDDARVKLAALDKARRDALYAIELIADGLRQTTGASIKDAQHLLDHASDGLDDMLGDIRQGYVDEIGDADEAIADIEDRDLRLSSPVVL